MSSGPRTDFSAYDLLFVDGDIDPVPPKSSEREELYELVARPADIRCAVQPDLIGARGLDKYG